MDLGPPERLASRYDTPIEPGQVRAAARELFGIELCDAPLLFEVPES